jgi:hypothetical protein
VPVSCAIARLMMTSDPAIRMNVSVTAVIVVMLMALVWIVLAQMQMGLRVAVMTVKENCTAGPLGSGIEENSSPPGWLDEDRLPTPASTGRSHL